MSPWKIRFLELAKHVAAWSKDPSTKVGAVIVDPLRRVVSLGYNGPPQGVKDNYVDREQKIWRTIHAETNAILFSHKNLDGCTLYVTHPSCSACAAKIIQVGIKEVVFPSVEGDFLERWADCAESFLMFEESKVLVTEVPHYELGDTPCKPAL